MEATIEKKFEAIGARVKIGEPRGRENFVIDVRRDSEGEFFDIRVKEEIEMMILDAQKKDRHLLLMTKEPIRDRVGQKKSETKAKFLCGHDERHWFTCAIPESAQATTVSQAKQALKPRELVDIETQEGIKTKNKHKRHRALKSGKRIHRQGEFMFVPQIDFQPPEGNLTKIYKNEPMSGGGSNFHYAQFLYRIGGRPVHIYRNKVFSPKEFKAYVKEHPNEERLFRRMMQDPTVYVKGKITHREHATLDLGDVWHKVLVNTEAQSRAKRNVAFLD